MDRKARVAIIVSHPIQHFCPQYASLASTGTIQLKVFFASTLGYKKYVDTNFNREISWGNLQLDAFDHAFLNGEQLLPANAALDAPALDAALAEYRPDIMIVYGYFQAYQRRAFNWARKNKVKLAYIADSERRQKRNAVKELVKYPFIRWYFSKINYFLTVGNANEAFYRHYGVPAKKMIRMHFSIDIKYYQQSYAQKERLGSEVRSRYGIAEQEIVLSVVGKLVSWKNQQDIIDAMLLLEQQGVYLHLFIIGSGDTQAACEQKATALQKSKVHFTGFVNVEDLPGYYAATDIYVHPAAIEPHSLAISEAIYMGCPVVISDRCGSYGETDDVQEEKNGYMFTCGDIQQLADKIALLAGNKTKRTAFGHYSHTIAVQFQQRSHGGFMDELLARAAS